MSDIMFGFLCGAIPILILCGIYVLHMRSVVDDIISDEKQKLREYAAQEIEIRTNEKVKDILSGIRVNMPVVLENDSDMYWGDNNAAKNDAL